MSLPGMLTALLLISTPVLAQGRTSEAEASASVEALLRIVRVLAESDPAWQLDSNVIVGFDADPVRDFHRDSMVVARVLGPKVRIRSAVDPSTGCPVDRSGSQFDSCLDDDGVQILAIGRFGSVKNTVNFMVSVLRVGPRVDAKARAGRTWRIILDLSSDGRYVLRNSPIPMIH